MADRDTLVAMVTLADTRAGLDALASVLEESLRRHRGAPRAPVTAGAWAVEPVVAMPPRAAFFAQRETVPSRSAVGRVAAELVAPYPPGVPVLAPGEVVTAEALEALTAAREAGSRIAYAADPTLTTLDVVASG